MKTALDSSSPSAARKWLHRLLPVVALCLFSAAIWALNKQLSGFSLADFKAYVSELSLRHLLLVIAATVVGYIALVAYDGFAIRHIGRSLSVWRIALTAFIGFAFSLNIGQAVLSGGAVRMRFYTGWGIGTVDVTRIIGFNFVVGLIGQFLLAGILFVSVGVDVPEAVPVPFRTVGWLGWILLVVVVTFFAFVFSGKASVDFKGWHFSLPRPRIAIPAIVVAAVDWGIAGSVLYALIPFDSGIGYPEFIAIVMLAHVVAVLSMVPGGIGVFETVIISLLPESAPKESVLSAMIAFRVIYYLVPFLLAIAAFGIYEGAVIRRKVLGWILRRRR